MDRLNTIVLVHGFWVDGSCYRKIIPSLLVEGYEVIAVQNPLTSLADDVAATQRALDRVEGRCILVGHSWGGVVITAAGNDEKVAGLVYIAAIAPDRGESMIDGLSSYDPSPALDFMQEREGFVWLSRDGVRQTFADDLPAPEADLIYATQTAPSALLSQAKVQEPAAWNHKPSWYIVANHDRSVAPAYQHDAAKRIGATTTVLEASHVPMLSCPEEVLAVIRAAIAKSRM